MNTIHEEFFETAKKFSQKTALLYKKHGVYFPVSYGELAEKVFEFAFILQDVFAVQKNDRIAILSENRPEWPIADLGIMATCAVSVPLHTTLAPQAILNILQHSGSKILIVSNFDLLNKVLLNRNSLKFLEKIIIIDELSATQKAGMAEKIFYWDNLFLRNKSTQFKKMSATAFDLCTIIYTSGTTGEPKGVALSHNNFLSNAKAINEAVPVKQTDVFLSFLPLSHALERTAGQWVPLLFGATIAYAESHKTLAKNLKEIKPTILISVPKIFERFHDAIWDKINKSGKAKKSMFKWALKQKPKSIAHKIADALIYRKIRASLGGNLRLAVSGGAKLNENLARFFGKMGIVILEGYGLTETSPVVSVATLEDAAEFEKVGVGRPLVGVDIKISQEKEILVKGDNVFLGYYKNNQETKKCFDKAGWFCTGDLGFIDKNGFLSITGRKKEMLVLSNGKNVWPEPIELLLNNDRFISQSMIVGDNLPYVCALFCPDWQELEIFLRENNLPLQSHNQLSSNKDVLAIFQKRLDEKINPNLSDFEQIKKFALLQEEFSVEQGELTPTLKLRRHIILRNNQKIIDRFN